MIILVGKDHPNSHSKCDKTLFAVWREKCILFAHLQWHCDFHVITIFASLSTTQVDAEMLGNTRTSNFQFAFVSTSASRPYQESAVIWIPFHWHQVDNHLTRTLKYKPEFMFLKFTLSHLRGDKLLLVPTHEHSTTHQRNVQ